MIDVSDLSGSELDEHFLRRSFDVARRAVTHGNHPFGAILVDQHRNVLIEAENGYMPAHDGTAHAERLLATQACTTLEPGYPAATPRCIRRPNRARCARARSIGPASAGWSTA